MSKPEALSLWPEPEAAPVEPEETSGILGQAEVVLRIGDARDLIKDVPDGSVDLIATSPPYLALRSYLPAGHPDKAQEMGSEPTPAEFIDNLLDLTAEFRRVLAPHGSIAIELGDTYAGSGGGGGDYLPGGLREGQPGFTGSANASVGEQRAANAAHWRQKNRNRPRDVRPDHANGSAAQFGRPEEGGGPGWPLERSLCMIPELYRVALAYGINPLTGEESPAGRWRVRNVVVHGRPNPPVGALGDKWRPACSYWTVACVDRRWFDLDAVRTTPIDDSRRSTNGPRYVQLPDRRDHLKGYPTRYTNSSGAPPLDWIDDQYDEDLWTIPTSPYKGAHYACVDDQTEALTPFGWKRHDELGDGDVIAAYDIGADRVIWQPATFARYHVDDLDMVSINKRHTSQLLTPNHRVLLKTRKHPKPYVRRADDVTPGCQVMLSAPWLEKPEGSGPGEKLAELVGWFLSEGWLPGSGRGQPALAQSSTTNPEKVERIRQLLGAVGTDWREKEYHGTWRGRPYTMVTFVIKSGEVSRLLWATGKRLAAEMVFGWSDADARALLDGLVGGDGSTRDDGRRSFIQKDRAFADLFQALALRCGFTARLRPHGDGHCVQMADYNRWVTMRGANGTHAPIPRQRYTGIVWCPSVLSAFWLARRDGKPFITGNTFSPELVRRFIVSMCPPKVCTVCGKPSIRITCDPKYIDRMGSETVPQRRASGVGDGLGAHSLKPGASLSRLASTLGWSECGCGSGCRPTVLDDVGCCADPSHWRPGLVLDPFGGSGTTGMVAVGNGRDALLFDLDGRCLDLVRQRCGMFLREE